MYPWLIDTGTHLYVIKDEGLKVLEPIFERYPI